MNYSEKNVHSFLDVMALHAHYLKDVTERLQKLEAQSNIDRNESTSSPPPPAPIKRGRGRPKKNA